MRQFLVKLFLFSSPVFFLTIFTHEFYSTETGDLVRTGYIINLFPNYNQVFKNASDGINKCKKFIDSPKETDFTVLTIGDSFSDMNSVGYNRYLADNDSIKVLHFDQILSTNPIQNSFELVNGDFFDKRKFKFLILECVERNIVSNTENIDLNKKTINREIDSLLQKKTKKNHSIDGALAWKIDFHFNFYSNRIIKFPYNTLKYYLFNTCLFDKSVNKTTLSNSGLFSVPSRNLLFLRQDVASSQTNNITENVERLNSVLNNLHDRLQKKGVKLIVLPAPDKYDVYYNYITDKQGFNKPLFFEHFKKMSKKYIYIDSKKILSAAIPTTKDVYLYDDTHWSPWAAKLIAKDIGDQMKRNQ